MATTNGCYLGSIQYILGEQRDISEVIVDDDALVTMRELNVRKYRAFVADPLEVAAQCINAVLLAAGLTPNNIDCLLLASETLSSASHNRNVILDVAAAANLDRAQLLLVSGSECANAVMAVSYAKSLLQEMNWRNILVVSIDFCAPGADRRYHVGAQNDSSSDWIEGAATSILSDGAVGFLVTNYSQNQYRVLAQSRHNDLSLMKLSFDESMVTYARRTWEGFKYVYDDAQQQTTRAPLRKIFINNFNKSIMKAVMRSVGLSLSDTYLKCLPQNAHVFAADTLIALQQWAEGEVVQPGDKIGLMANGSMQKAMIVLERCEGVA